MKRLNKSNNKDSLELTRWQREGLKGVLKWYSNKVREEIKAKELGGLEAYFAEDSACFADSIRRMIEEIDAE